MRAAHWMVWLCLMAAAWPLRAQPVSSGELAQTRLLFQQGLRDEAANERAQAAVRALLEREPGHPLLMAWLGSSETLKGGYAWLPWNKLGHVETGLAQLDKALRLLGPAHRQGAPEAPPLEQEVRLIAANTYVALPGMFNTFDKGKALVQAMLGEPGLERWPEAFRAAVFLAAARVARREGDAAALERWLGKARPLARDDYARLELLELETSR